MAPTTSTPIYGNYHGYYIKRPSIKDPRLALLPPDHFINARVLDIGCNEGWVTCEIAQLWGASKVVGVDIDDTLISASWRRRRTVWSLQAPPEPTSLERLDLDIPPKKRRRLLEETQVPRPLNQPDYFPASCEHEFGPLPVPPSQNRGRHVFPHNVSFRTADWVNTAIPEDSERYNAIIAFSVSKWIHLNEGDEGLKTFFRRVWETLEVGGTFILEPQAWDTYAKARRMDVKLKENAKNIKLHPEDFESVLVGLGFSSAQHLGTTGEGGFHRPVDMYIKL